MDSTEVNFNIMILRFFSISQLLQVLDMNFMLVHCSATLDTTIFGHIWFSCSIDK